MIKSGSFRQTGCLVFISDILVFTMYFLFDPGKRQDSSHTFAQELLVQPSILHFWKVWCLAETATFFIDALDELCHFLPSNDKTLQLALREGLGNDKDGPLSAFERQDFAAGLERGLGKRQGCVDWPDSSICHSIGWRGSVGRLVREISKLLQTQTLSSWSQY